MILDLLLTPQLLSTGRDINPGAYLCMLPLTTADSRLLLGPKKVYYIADHATLQI